MSGEEKTKDRFLGFAEKWQIIKKTVRTEPVEV
jgi:hypothetical protein